MKQLLVLLFFISSIWVNAQTKAGYFDHQQVTDALFGSDITENLLEKLVVKYRDSIEFKLLAHERHTEPYDSIDLTEKELQALEDSIKKMELEIRRLNEDFLLRSGMLKETLELEKEIELKSYIKEFCKRNELSLLVDKADLWYCENCRDYTQELIAFIKERN